MIMLLRISAIFTRFSILAGLSLLFICCSADDFMPEPDQHGNNTHHRVVGKETRNVLLLYSAGFNSISDYLYDDIQELKRGWLPGNQRNDNVMLVYTHQPSMYGNYFTETSPYLIRLYSDSQGAVVADTLVTYPKGTVSASALQLNKVLNEVKKTFPAKGYSMIFSSHATGYLPAGFYQTPNKYVFSPASMMSANGLRDPYPVPYVEPEQDPSLPRTRSIGQDQTGRSGNYVSHEIDIRDFAEAIPMKMDHILFDACLMGGIEVAYELRGKCGLLGFSQAEVLGEGLDYSTLSTHLLKASAPDPQKVCEDYFAQYETQQGVYRSATISLIDCDRLQPLADVCRGIFSDRRQGMNEIISWNVQQFFRSGKHWFYDLESIITEAGASEDELSRLHAALEECVIYKAHTPEFMMEFPITTFSGFSMYLPSNGNLELNKYYRTLRWNEATGLVE